MWTIKKLITKNVLTLKKEATIEDAASILSHNEGRCIIVTDNDMPVGTITESDVMRIVAMNQGMKVSVGKVMKSPIVSMTSLTTFESALNIIDTKGVNNFPIIENNLVVGMVKKKDIVNSVSEYQRVHRNIQNAVLILFTLFEFMMFIYFGFLGKLLGVQ